MFKKIRNVSIFLAIVLFVSVVCSISYASEEIKKVNKGASTSEMLSYFPKPDYYVVVCGVACDQEPAEWKTDSMQKYHDIEYTIVRYQGQQTEEIEFVDIADIVDAIYYTHYSPRPENKWQGYKVTDAIVILRGEEGGKNYLLNKKLQSPQNYKVCTDPTGFLNE
ncbi:MAG: hypothetical protein WCV70_00990 [Patescibacteria group bacterium]|jgi:hypothetical protein